MDLADIRKDYRFKVLDENLIDHNPFKQFERWLNEAFDAKANEPTAMVLATASLQGIPSSRIVLLKAFSEQGFGFFTNYTSRKGEEIEANHHVALLFHWPELERQVRVEGIAARTSASVSDEYFNSRPYESRLSAVISNQSQVVPDREYLEMLWSGQQHQSFAQEVRRRRILLLISNKFGGVKIVTTNKIYRKNKRLLLGGAAYRIINPI